MNKPEAYQYEDIYHGNPRILLKNEMYPLKLRSFVERGLFEFGIVLEDEEREMKHSIHLDFFYDNMSTSKLQNSKSKPRSLDYDLLMVMVCDETLGEFRARIIMEPMEDGTVVVLNIDTGFVNRTHISTLHRITNEYAELPYDSAMCHIEGLELFEDTPIMAKCVENLMHGLEKKENLFGICCGYRAGLPVIQLKDGEHTNATNMHGKMLKYILRKCSGQWPAGKERVPASIAHTAADGKVYLHLADSFVYTLEDIIPTFSAEKLAEAKLCFEREGVVEGAVYLAPQDGVYYRALVLKEIQTPIGAPEKVHVNFIDYGNTEVVLKDTLLRASAIDNALQNMAPLAHQAYLKGVKKIANMKLFIEKTEGYTFELEVRTSKHNSLPNIVLHMADGCFNETLFAQNIAVKY